MQPSSPPSLDRPFLTGQPDVVQLTFVRHGKQEMPSGAFTPALWADPPLSGLGQRQAAAGGKALADEPIAAVLCSHLQRAVETAREVAAPHGLEPVVYPELREVETYRDVPVVEGILALHKGQQLAVVCHGGVINAYIGHLLGLRQDMFFRPAHASVSRVLTGDGRRVIHTLNELHHLQAADHSLVTFWRPG